MDCSIKQILLNILNDNEEDKLPTQYAGMKYQNNGFSITLKYITSNNFRLLYKMLGKCCIKFFVKDCILIQKQGDIYVQLSGNPLDNLLNDTKAIAKHIKSNTRKENQKNIKNNLADLNKNLNRNGILYCLHSNGKPGLFRKSLLMRVAGFVNRNVENKEGFDEMWFTKGRIVELMNKMDSNYRKSNQHVCSKNDKENRNEGSKGGEGGESGKNALKIEKMEKEVLGEKGKYKVSRNVKFKKKKFARGCKKKGSNEKIQIEKEDLVKTEEEKQKIYQVAGKVLIEYIFRFSKQTINKQTRAYFEEVFGKFAKNLAKMRFDKIFYHYCSNSKKFEYSVIKNAFDGLKEVKDLKNFKKKSVQIKKIFRTKEKKYLKKNKKLKKDYQSIITDLENQETAEKYIACMLDSLNKMNIEDNRIYQFLKEIVWKLLPRGFFGRKNQKIIEKASSSTQARQRTFIAASISTGPMDFRPAS